MALILNMDSSTEVCSVSLFMDNVLLEERENSDGLNHAELLTAFVEEVLTAQNLKATDLDAVAIAGGPGSYTGLRIGVSAAKGICYAGRLPLIAISSLKAMAHQVSSHPSRYNVPIDDDALFCPMIDARRMEVFTAMYNIENNEVQPISAEIVDHHSFSQYLDKGPVIFFGNGAKKCQDAITHPNAIFVDNVTASSLFMGPLAEKAFQEKDFVDVAYYEPFYLKDFIATAPKKNVFGKKPQ